MPTPITLFTILFIALASAQWSPVPLGTPYNGLTRPLYVPAAITLDWVIPGVGVIESNTYSGYYGNDPANSRFAFDIGSGKQYTFANATYQVLNLPTGQACFIVDNYTYAFEGVAKSGAIKVGVSDLFLDHYFGFVNDGGAGLAVKIAFDVFVNTITNSPVEIDFSQNLPQPHNPDGSCPPAVVVLTGYVSLPPTISTQPPPASFFQLPAICADAYPYQAVFCL